MVKASLGIAKATQTHIKRRNNTERWLRPAFFIWADTVLRITVAWPTIWLFPRHKKTGSKPVFYWVVFNKLSTQALSFSFTPSVT